MEEKRLVDVNARKVADMNVRRLTKALNDIIENSNATYDVVIRALKWLQIAYQDKGDSFLADINIKDIANIDQKLSVRLPREDD